MSLMPRRSRYAVVATVLFSALLAAPVCASPPPTADGDAGLQGSWVGKEFDQLTHTERLAAREAAHAARFKTIRVCLDPNNMPLSDQAGRGFENKIIGILGRSLGARVSYRWRSYTRDIVSEAFNGTNDECDVLMGVPYPNDMGGSSQHGGALLTIPIYRSTYVLAWRKDENLSITSLNDPQLKRLRIGTFEVSPLRQALAEHGIVANVHVQYATNNTALPQHQLWRQVQEVADGTLDVAGTWGPVAGWLKTMKGDPLVIQPTNLMDDTVPMEFSIGIGVPPESVLLKYALDDALKAHRAEITAILEEYGVPLVKCGDCLVPGSLPAHGNYTAPPPPTQDATLATHWTVSRAEVDKSLAAGASIGEEFDDAVLANDVDRAAYLIGKGADVNRKDNLGRPPLVMASMAGCVPMMRLLTEHGASIHATDGSGWTPLMNAVRNNHVPAVRFLITHGADVNHAAPGGYTPLSIALIESEYDAAAALIKAGADVNVPVSIHRITPLMVIAGNPPESITTRMLQRHGPSAVARALLAHKANVNATDADGVTALMIAAAHNNAAMIAMLLEAGANPHLKSHSGQTARQIALANNSREAAQALSLFQR